MGLVPYQLSYGESGDGSSHASVLVNVFTSLEYVRLGVGLPGCMADLCLHFKNHCLTPRPGLFISTLFSFISCIQVLGLRLALELRANWCSQFILSPCADAPASASLCWCLVGHLLAGVKGFGLSPQLHPTDLTVHSVPTVVLL